MLVSIVRKKRTHNKNNNNREKKAAKKKKMKRRRNTPTKPSINTRYEETANLFHCCNSVLVGLIRTTVVVVPVTLFIVIVSMRYQTTITSDV